VPDVQWCFSSRPWTPRCTSGVLQGSATPVTLTGIWRAGAEQLSGWPNNPTDFYFEEGVHELAVSLAIAGLPEPTPNMALPFGASSSWRRPTGSVATVTTSTAQTAPMRARVATRRALVSVSVMADTGT